MNTLQHICSKGKLEFRGKINAGNSMHIGVRKIDSLSITASSVF